jgi:hypothetical protein
MTNIEWIIELENHPLYFVSNLGKAYSLKNNKWGERKELKELKLGKNKGGYLYFVSSGRKCENVYIHRIVAETFLKRVKGKNIVDHINRNKLDNRVENLRWTDNRGNMINSKLRKGNKSGVKGVVYNKKNNSWDGLINIEKRKTTSRSFKTKEDAISWRKEMEKKYYKT